MRFIVLAINIIKALLFLGNLWKEKDKEKSLKKAKIGKKIVDAFKQTDKKQRASHLNVAVGHINRVR